MELIWVPTKLECCRETLQLLDQYGNKKDISVILKSVELKKVAKRTGNVFHQVPKKLKMKNPSPPRNLIARRSIVTKKTSIVETVEIHKLRSPLGQRNEHFNIDAINFSSIDMTYETRTVGANEDQENTSPNTPVNASSLFDNLKFTPATETKSKSTSKLEYLASLPTPQDLRREDFVQINNTTRRNLIINGISPDQPRFSLSKQQTPNVTAGFPNYSILSHLATPSSTKKFRKTVLADKVMEETPQPGSSDFDPAAFSTISRAKKNAVNFDMLEKRELNMDNTGSPATAETYIKLDAGTSCNEIQIIFPEDPIPEPAENPQILEAISEEDSKESQKNTTNFQKTFNIDKKSLSEDDLAVDKNDSSLSRRILSESMREFGKHQELEKLKNNQGSLPNLNEAVESLSSNRYYLQVEKPNEPNLSMESIVSTSEFQEREINAQSSRFNLNEIGLQIESKEIVVDSFASPKSRAKRLADSPILASSPTIRRVVRTDATFKSPWKKGSVMTFSPPKVKRICNEVVDSFEMPAPKGREIRVNSWKQARVSSFNFIT
jgi:abnormal spindle-like microcephaly-associated protein